MVKVRSSFDVADHDFTKFRMLPSVVLILNISHETSQNHGIVGRFMLYSIRIFISHSYMPDVSSILSSLQQEKKIAEVQACRIICAASHSCSLSSIHVRHFTGKLLEE